MNTNQNTNQNPQTNEPTMQVTNQTAPVNNTQANNNSMEMIEFSNDIAESKGVLNDDTTTTKPQDDFSDKTINTVNKLINTTDYTSYFGTNEVKQYKNFATLCYIPLVALYFKFFKKLDAKSKYMQYHIKEGTNLTLLWIFAIVISRVLYTLFTKKYLMSEETPGWVSFITYVLYCLAIVITIVGLYRTSNGKSKDLPIIGKYKFLK